MLRHTLCGLAWQPAGTKLTRRLLLLLSLFLLAVPIGSRAAETKGQFQAADLVQDNQPIDLKQEKYQQLFQELREQHRFSQGELQRIFNGLTIQRKILELMDRQVEAKPYYSYAPLFITEQNIRRGREMLIEHKELLDRIEARFGVEREVLVAVWGVESRYGGHVGDYNILRTLNTLFDAYPRRSRFFRQQLIDFLLLCRENQLDPSKMQGSYAAAFGQTQFIPSSFLAYAVDFDGDGVRDVWRSTPDVLASIANYLARFHWQFGAPRVVELGKELSDTQLVAAFHQGRKGRVSWRQVVEAQGRPLPEPPGGRELAIVGLEVAPDRGGGLRYLAAYPNFQAITEWNHSNRYAMVVLELAEAYIGNPDKQTAQHLP